MAHKKAAGSTDNGRDSNSKRLGVKLYGGQVARAGNIIIRQRGSKFHIGENTYFGKDWTVHAKIDGKVSYRKGFKNRVFVSIDPVEAVAETAAPVKVTKKAATVSPKVASAPAVTATADKLTKIEGIGPKIAELLNNAGITTFAIMASTDVAKLKEILSSESKFARHNPITWPQQATLAAAGKWDELKQWQKDNDANAASSEEE